MHYFNFESQTKALEDAKQAFEGAHPDIKIQYYNKKLFRDAGFQQPPQDWNEFFWVDLLHDGSVSRDVVNWNNGDVANQFIGGTAAMMLSGPYTLPLVKQSGVEFGVVPVPVPKIGMKPVVPIGGEVWCVMKNDKNIEDAALKFIQFMQDRDRLLKLCLTFNYVSSVRDVAQKEVEIDPDMKPYYLQMETARPRVEEGGDNYPQISQIARTAIQEVLSGQSSIDDAFADAAGQIKQFGGK